MAKHFPTQALPTLLANLFPRLYALGLVALSLCAAGPALADDLTLQPYRAAYEVSMGNINTEVHRQLHQKEDGSWRVSDATRILFFSMQEQALMYLDGDRIIPQRYNYQQSPGSSKDQTIVYNWDTGVATCKVDDGIRKAPLEGRRYDKLSYQLQLHVDLMRGNFGEGKSYHIIDRGRLKHYHIERVAEESIQVGKRTFNTWKLRQRREGKDRETLIWVAPELNFLMVRTERIEDDEHYIMQLKSASLM